ncbi:ATP-binding cassette domain-containing protein, partial [Haladaptatus sp. W1]|uniref:ATP-binding cassette domain-containing protein n=1 Tax=Haladaptatus sp. W1 TaxID=1897478 RepID=UPI000B01A11F
MSFEIDIGATFTTSGADPFDLDAEFEVETGETLVVLGPSGSGKTLLLETVAGYHDHSGRVFFDGRDVTDDPPEERDFGFVFQDYALFPHLTVRENVAFGARYHPDALDAESVLDDLGVAHLADRRPRTLS